MTRITLWSTSESAKYGLTRRYNDQSSEVLETQADEIGPDGSPSGPNSLMRAMPPENPGGPGQSADSYLRPANTDLHRPIETR